MAVFRRIVGVDGESTPGGLPGHLRAVTASDQQRCEPRERFQRVQRAETRHPGAGQRIGPLVLVSRVRQHGLDHVRRHPGGHQRADDGSPARSLDAEGVFGHLPGERLVVDETDPLESFEDIGDLLGLEPRLEQPPLQFPPAPCANGQQAERALVAALRVARPSSAVQAAPWDRC